jgi:hypothetical protein
MPLDHYVSQVHLKNFYSPALGELMYAMRKSDLKRFTPNAQSVCRIEDGSTNAYMRENRAIEEILKTIEPRYNSAVAKLIGDNIDPECIYTIVGFVAYVITCSPTGMRVFSEPLKAVVETEAVSAEKHGLLPPPPEELGGKSLAELLRTGDIEIKIDQKYPQALGISTMLRHVAIFGNCKWDVLLNRFEESPFFTSDFPAAIELTKDWRVLNRIVPLAPNLAVRIKPDLNIDRKRADFSFANFDRRIKHVSFEEITEINELIVRCAENSVFYCNDRSWIEKFIARNRGYRIEPTTRKIAQGKGTLLISSQRILPWHADRCDSPFDGYTSRRPLVSR